MARLDRVIKKVLASIYRAQVKSGKINQKTFESKIRFLSLVRFV